MSTELERLKKENLALWSRLSYLNSTCGDLESRISRIESSVVFRFLRWLGPRLSRLGIPGLSRLAQWSPDTAEADYGRFAQDAILLKSAFRQLRTESSAVSASVPPVSILVEANRLGQANFERLADSILQQWHRDWELIVMVADTPAWMEAALAPLRSGHRVEIVRAEAFSKCSAEFVLVVHSEAILEPDALQELLQAADPDAIAVYSDWDHVNAAGRFHSPRFTPELSPELLRRTSYWGPSYLARREFLQQAPHLDNLPLFLAEKREPIRRVPEVLSHLPADTPEDLAAKTIPFARNTSTRVSVIVCSCDAAQLTRCLESLQPTLDERHEVIVVAHDRGGSGAALQQVTQKFQVRSVPYSGPFHFGLMNHLGVAEATGDILCLINDDVEPIAPDWLERMRSQAERPDFGIVGALLLYPDGTIQHAGVIVGGGNLPKHIGRTLSDSPYWPWLRMTRDVSAVTGACVALRREVWDELGGFDLRFPANYNDIDLCLRARARGYRILIEAEATLIHHESKTRNSAVLPEESALFREIWNHIILSPAPFFHPQLELRGNSIQLKHFHLAGGGFAFPASQNVSSRGAGGSQ